jgi:hypothetical protein
VESASKAVVTLEALNRIEQAAADWSAGERQAFHQLKYDYLESVVRTSRIVSDGLGASLAREIKKPPEPIEPQYVAFRKVGRAVEEAANEFLDGVFEVVTFGLYKGR